MNRNDLVYAGVRLYGLYLFVDGLLALPTMLQMALVGGAVPFVGEYVALGLRLVLGVVLFLGAGRLAGGRRDRDLVPGPELPR